MTELRSPDSETATISNSFSPGSRLPQSGAALYFQLVSPAAKLVNLYSLTKTSAVPAGTVPAKRTGADSKVAPSAGSVTVGAANVVPPISGTPSVEVSAGFALSKAESSTPSGLKLI